MKRFFYQLIGILLCLHSSVPAWADDSEITVSFLSIVKVVVDLIFGLCHAVGLILVCMTIIFYRRYRKNHVETPIGKVIWTFLLGIGIFIVPFVGQQLNIYQTMVEAAHQHPQSTD